MLPSLPNAQAAPKVKPSPIFITVTNGYKLQGCTHRNPEVAA